MRASTKILGKIEQALTSPGWTYCVMWHFAPFMAPARMAAQLVTERRSESGVRR